MVYRPCGSIWGQFFGVPISVVDKHLKLCGSTALKVLLVILRSPSEAYDAITISQALSLDKSDVADALNYWVVAGVLEQVEQEQALTSMKEVPPTVVVAPVILPATPTTQAEQESVGKEAKKTTSTVTLGSRVRYPREEMLKIIKGDKTLGDLQHEVQSILAKTLTSADMDSLTALYSHYGLSAHYIVSLLHYCASINRRSMAYAESVAAAWMNEDIDDANLDAHIETLHCRRSGEGKVRAAFGIDRALISKEKKYIHRWMEELSFDMDMILFAYELTVSKTGKCAFGYIDKILSNWKQQDITTVEQAQNEQRPSSTQKQPAVAAKIDYQNIFFKKMMEED